MNRAPSPVPGRYLVKGNATWATLTPSTESSPWEYHIIVVVVIFGLVCLLHLAAFLYAICFQHHGHYRPVTMRHSRRPAYEESEIATFHPSPPGNASEARRGSDTMEECSSNATFWGSFLRQA